ncbi:hypothetical protein [Streptomyces sp. MMG1121]|nr:hypothetical protein [Streptomyces sp. MMG1121]
MKRSSPPRTRRIAVAAAAGPTGHGRSPEDEAAGTLPGAAA